MAKRSKYIIIDREIEEGFIVGDMKVLGGIIGRSPRTIQKWLLGTRYRDQGRFIIVRNPLVAKTRHGGKITEHFLSHKFKKK